MGRQTNGTTVLYSSSLALLQERFRQLQKIKDIRKEKLLRIFAEAEHASQRTCEQAKCFFHPELIQPSRLLHDGSPSLQLDSYSNRSKIQPLETSLSIGLQPNKGMHASQNSNETDVDTTLHL